MQHKFNYPQLLIASNNRGKIKEFIDLIAPYNIEILSAADFNIEEPEETGLTFLENAILKAEYYGKLTNLPALSDDSGISIKALDNYPGIYSARIAGPNKDYNLAFADIEKKLGVKGLTSSQAHFTCSIALRYPNGEMHNFEGIVEGTVSFPHKGTKGFGYDPIFTPNGYEQTFAEMKTEEKYKLSHRSLALKKLLLNLF
jgi:XTP/dITP diphosphohydrolase